tara:strand:+ start:39 stop:431 length:393 start_codon:yes stop_codon:yes gene_type:complete
MAFKLGSRSGPLMDKGQIKSGLCFKQEDSGVPGTPVLRKSLDKGILGEANNDGSIFLSDKIVPGSEQEREVLIHEMVHMTDMKTGKLGYTDEAVTYMGETFPRHKGYILYNNEWMPEGDKNFPWERMPWE